MWWTVTLEMGAVRMPDVLGEMMLTDERLLTVIFDAALGRVVEA
jgi:hypothetical protein